MDEEVESRYKTRILKALEDIDEKEINLVLEYLRSEEFPSDLKKIKQLHKDEDTLAEIGESVKEMVPFEAEFGSENIMMPDIGDHTDCNDKNTCHVDEFLYDDDEIDQLVAEGKVTKYICSNCNSRQIKELIMISHSMSKKMLQFIFKVLLPEDLHGKCVLDIGSRLGGVLYATYHFSNAESIIGIEKNQEMCQLQEKIIAKFSMDKNRIKVIQSDVLNCFNIVHNADVVILNVLDFFVTMREQQEIWKFFKQWFKKDTYFITNRGVPETLGYLNLEEDFTGWLTVCKPFQLHNEKFFDLTECNFNELYLYTVN